MNKVCALLQVLKNGHHVGHDKSPLGVVQIPLLERRDGIDPSRTPGNNIRNSKFSMNKSGNSVS